MTYAILAIGCAVAGCNSSSTSNDNTAASNDMMANDMATDADADLSGAARGVSANTMVDAGFVTEAMKGNNSEVAMGKMAQADGRKSQAVKDFGKMLSPTDHAAANDTAQGARNPRPTCR